MATLADLPLQFIQHLSREKQLQFIATIRGRRAHIITKPIKTPKARVLKMRQSPSTKKLAQAISHMTEEQAALFVMKLMERKK